MFSVIKANYKGVISLKVTTKKYEAVFLPKDGSKFVSFKQINDNYEYLYQNLSAVYKRIRIDDSYIDGECSGFDDMFPTIDPIICKSGLRADKLYNDHGEICRSCFTYKIFNDALEMVFVSKRLNYIYTKTVTTNADEDIIISCSIENLAKDDFVVLWAAHCMLNADKNDRLLLPYLTNSPIKIMFDTNSEFGKRDDKICLSEEMITLNDFSEKGNSFKYYFTDKINKGMIGLKKQGHKAFYIEYDPDKLPYLGIWVNNGSFKNMQCVALEPCTAAYDTIYNAEKNGQKCTIKPGENLCFDLKIYLK